MIVSKEKDTTTNYKINFTAETTTSSIENIHEKIQQKPSTSSLSSMKVETLTPLQFEKKSFLQGIENIAHRTNLYRIINKIPEKDSRDVIQKTTPFILTISEWSLRSDIFQIVTIFSSEERTDDTIQKIIELLQSISHNKTCRNHVIKFLKSHEYPQKKTIEVLQDLILVFKDIQNPEEAQKLLKILNTVKINKVDFTKKA